MQVRLREFRFRVRSFLILVAFVAFGLGGTLWMNRRAAAFRRLALDYRDSAKISEIAFAVGNERFGEFAIYQRMLQTKYEYAASHPWLPVDPDPPF